jgi:hypothetical protein
VLWTLGRHFGRLEGGDERLAGIDGRLAGANGRMEGVDGRLVGANGRLAGALDGWWVPMSAWRAGGNGWRVEMGLAQEPDGLEGRGGLTSAPFTLSSRLFQGQEISNKISEVEARHRQREPLRHHRHGRHIDGNDLSRRDECARIRGADERDRLIGMTSVESSKLNVLTASDGYRSKLRGDILRGVQYGLQDFFSIGRAGDGRQVRPD